MEGRTCNKCGFPKEAGAFEKNGNMPDGSPRLRSICKACGSRLKIERPEPRKCTKCGRKKKAKEFQGKRGSWCKKCHNEAVYTYRRGPGRIAHNARMVEYSKAKYTTSARFRLKHRARQAVIKAVREGLLIRPARCPECNRKCRLHGHHYMGYAKNNWLNVKWLCPKCHRKEDYPAKAV